MSVKTFFSVPDQAPIQSVGLLVMRVAAGAAFMLHGFGKIQNPFDWMGPESTVPGLFQALAAASEFGGGLAWILGLLTPLASLGIISTMAVAAWTHLVVRGDPFVGKGATAELAVIYLCLALLFLVIGPGQFSCDWRLFGRSKRLGVGR